MKNIRVIIILSTIIVTCSGIIFYLFFEDKSKEGMIIFTRTAEKVQDINYMTGDSFRHIPQAQIVAFYKDKIVESLKILTKDFFSARSPKISNDGKYLLFAAQQKQNHTWQIWEMNLKDLKSRQVTSSKENCIDPAYLPDGRLVFCRLDTNDKLKAGNSLYICNSDGSDINRITFNPHTYFQPIILKDGRVLTISSQVYPHQGFPMFMILRPDGTKAELFYKFNEGGKLYSGGCETINDKILFVESDEGKQRGGNIISISYKRPLHSRVNLTSEIQGDFRAVFPQNSGKILVSYRKSVTDRYAIYEFDQENKKLGQSIYRDNSFDVLEVVAVEKHERAKILPSEVDTGVQTGLLLCQNVNFPENRIYGNGLSFSRAHKIRVTGIDLTLGVVQVEEDGSFYLKIIADTPFQIQTLDEKDQILSEPSAWIWLRPNERRGCVGCHEDHEVVPENRVPQSVKKAPLNIPDHLSKVSEKKISLE